MSRTLLKESRSQQTLQSYLDELLQDASLELTETVSQDEFQAAVLEEQLRDRQRVIAPAQVQPIVEVTESVAPLTLEPELAPVAPQQALIEPVATLETAGRVGGPPQYKGGQPEWGEAPFECLLFDVAGLTLAVPLISLGSIYPLAGQELTPLFGQPDWFLGILPSQAGNLKVLDTARWVMADRYRDDFRQGLQYVISVQGYEWGLAVHQVSRSIRLDPREVKWRSQRTQRPWLAGTVIDHMCALLDVAALAELIASGATRRLKGVPS
ncbi:CheW domain-containing protein [Stutzerimonas sp. NM35]|uniref:CheW domain-containing protein n=1 Tax=Stutzerimonas stutzeri TaxID=316 RepID=UPI0015E3BE23|nr:CheW domain-containing protein [Stutzerimonas stutzeri]MBA1261688.1 chemotaxis protein CheW [Stutzerimonas stutzeri]